MSNISDEELIKVAEAALNSQKIDDFYVADVGCALISEAGQLYSGACIGGDLGVHAEQSAMSILISKESPRIKKIVAVWRDEHGGKLYVIPPCGKCREFLRVMSQDNLEADVMLGPDHIVKLKDLLPFYGWHAEKV